jgi:hypothetical protein
MADYIKHLIEGGENQTVEFKFEVPDFRKIARTLVAFSNTDGGRLLVGVKDNGVIAGVRSEEEYFMIDGAARLYCKPEVSFETRQWQVERKKVMEVIIGKGEQKPYLAQDPDGRWIAFIRQGDQNFKASRILLQAWEMQGTDRVTTIRFREAHRVLLTYLEGQPFITLSKFRRIAGLSQNQADEIMLDFILLGLIRTEHTANSVLYCLSESYKRIIEGLSFTHNNKV